MPAIRNAIRRLALASLAAPMPSADALDVSVASDAPPAVVVVLSREAEPHRLTEKGVRGTLAPHGVTVTTVHLGAAGPPEKALASAHVIVGVGTEAAVWLQAHAPSEADLVYCMVADPVGARLDEGRSMHGVKGEVPVAKQISFLSAALPQARRVGVLYRGDSRRGTAALDAFRRAAPAAWTIQSVDAAAAPSTSTAIESLLSQKPDVIWTMPDGVLFEMATVRKLLSEAIKAGVPVFGFSAAFVRAGATLGVGIEPEPHGRQAGELVLRVIEERRSRGGPLNAPITLEPRYQFAINLGVAEQIGVKIPEPALRQAEIVIGGEH